VGQRSGPHLWLESDRHCLVPLQTRLSPRCRRGETRFEAKSPLNHRLSGLTSNLDGVPAHAGIYKDQVAIRYSGDVELRLQYGGAGYRRGNKEDPFFDPDGEGFYFTTVRAPHVRSEAILSLREVGLDPSITRNQATASESYDTAALALLKWVEINLGKLPVELDDHNHIVVRRVFQSPCPHHE
jgi:hypothetical protein